VGGSFISYFRNGDLPALLHSAGAAAPFITRSGEIGANQHSHINQQKKEGASLTTVAKVIELVGESGISWDDAVRNAVKEASKTIDGITGVELVNCTASLDNGEIKEYKVNLKVAFGVREDR
jgi:flavin-binding protein dodecin